MTRVSEANWTEAEKGFAQLVARLCRAPTCAPTGSIPDELAELRENAQWGHLVRSSRLAPLAYRAGCLEFQTDYARTAILAEMRSELLKPVFAKLAASGLPCCLVKGISYAYNLYEDPAARPMGDVDLMVPRSDFSSAARALVTLGFRPRKDKRAHFAQTHHALTLDGPNHLTIDLHRSMIQPLRSNIRLAELWSRAQPVPTLGPLVLRLSDADEILFNVIHIARHELLSGPLAYVDLAWLEARAQCSRERILERARRYRLERSARAVFHMADTIAAEMPRDAAGRFLVLPGLKEVLLTRRMGRLRQVATKFALVEGPREAAGLLAVALYERLPHHRRSPAKLLQRDAHARTFKKRAPLE